MPASARALAAQGLLLAVCTGVLAAEPAHHLSLRWDEQGAVAAAGDQRVASRALSPLRALLEDPQQYALAWRLARPGWAIPEWPWLLEPRQVPVAGHGLVAGVAWLRQGEGIWTCMRDGTGHAETVAASAELPGLAPLSPDMLRWRVRESILTVAVGWDGPAWRSAGGAVPAALVRSLAALPDAHLVPELLGESRGSVVLSVASGAVLPGVALALPRGEALDRLLQAALTRTAACPMGAGRWRVDLLAGWWTAEVERGTEAWLLRSDSSLAWVGTAPNVPEDTCVWATWRGTDLREGLLQAVEVSAAQVDDPARAQRLASLVQQVCWAEGDGELQLAGHRNLWRGHAVRAPSSLGVLLALGGQLLAAGPIPGWREWGSNDALAEARLRGLIWPVLAEQQDSIRPDWAAAMAALAAHGCRSEDWDGYDYRVAHPAAGRWVVYANPRRWPRSGRRCYALLDDGFCHAQVLGERASADAELWEGGAPPQPPRWPLLP